MNTNIKMKMGLVGLMSCIGVGLANAVETGKPAPAQQMQAKPIPAPMMTSAPQMNETQMLRAQIQQLQTQVAQLSNDVQTLRSRYNDHTHALVGIGTVGTQIVPSLSGIILSGGGGDMKVLTVRGSLDGSRSTSGPSR